RIYEPFNIFGRRRGQHWTNIVIQHKLTSLNVSRLKDNAISLLAWTFLVFKGITFVSYLIFITDNFRLIEFELQKVHRLRFKEALLVGYLTGFNSSIISLSFFIQQMLIIGRRGQDTYKQYSKAHMRERPAD